MLTLLIYPALLGEVIPIHSVAITHIHQCRLFHFLCGLLGMVGVILGSSGVLIRLGLCHPAA
jgi:hypothetical protein